MTSGLDRSMVFAVKLQLVQETSGGTVMFAVNGPTAAPPVPRIDHAPGVMNVDGSPVGTTGTNGRDEIGIPGMPPPCARNAAYPVLTCLGMSAALPAGPMRDSLGPASSGPRSEGMVVVGGLMASMVSTRQVPGGLSGGTAPGVWVSR